MRVSSYICKFRVKRQILKLLFQTFLVFKVMKVNLHFFSVEIPEFFSDKPIKNICRTLKIKYRCEPLMAFFNNKSTC